MNATRGVTESIDITIIKNNTLPETWKCPHCYKRNRTGMHADEILIENGKYIENCTMCGHLHLFRLNLTDYFKEKVVDFIKNY